MCQQESDELIAARKIIVLSSLLGAESGDIRDLYIALAASHRRINELEKWIAGLDDRLGDLENADPCVHPAREIPRP